MSWALAVAGFFLVAYAVLVLLRPAKKGAGHRRESLGCGFVLLAGAVWGLALWGYLGSWWSGLRLGVALALVLPALVTLTHRRHGGVVTSVVLLIIAVILGAPEVPRLLDRFKLSRPEAKVQELEATVTELGDRIGRTEDHIEELADDRDDLRDELEDRGYKDFEALAQDPNAYSLLKELAEVDRLLEQAETRLAAMRRLRDRATSAARRMGRIADAESATGVEVDEAEIAEILAEARAEPVDAGPMMVEEYVERERLKELFESEF